ncbi:MAG: hypothetical protein V5A25_10470 [Halovenus sp.]
MTDRVAADRITAIRGADDLADLVSLFDAESIHDAYFAAKDVWETAVRQRQGTTRPDGLAGTTVEVDGQLFHIHGITHAGTNAEREFLRSQVTDFRERGHDIYCEQGIRSMYFEDMPAVCEMDDYLWAMRQCEQLEGEFHLPNLPETGLDAVMEDVTGVTSTFREATFSLIEAGRAAYGEPFERALGDIAAAFLTDHAESSIGRSYEAFRLREAASREPERLVDLQRYYERTFLPQPHEREWLRRHDPELELVSHARNERIADYAIYHGGDDDGIHLIVGAAHQPGVAYYLEQYREGRELPDGFQLY